MKAEGFMPSTGKIWLLDLGFMDPSQSWYSLTMALGQTR